MASVPLLQRDGTLHLALLNADSVTTSLNIRQREAGLTARARAALLTGVSYRPRASRFRLGVFVARIDPQRFFETDCFFNHGNGRENRSFQRFAFPAVFVVCFPRPRAELAATGRERP